MTLQQPPPQPSPSDSSSARLVGDIMAKRPRLGALLRLTAVPLWFDEDLLTALRDRGDDREAGILSRINQFSFVHSSNGRYWYGSDMRRMLLLEWHDDQEGFREANRRARDFFQAHLASTPPQNPVAYEELVQSHLFHALVVDEEDGLRLLRRLFRKAEKERRLAAAEQYVAVAEEQRPFLSGAGRVELDYMAVRVDQLYERWPQSAERFEELLARDNLPPGLVPRAQRALALALVEQKRWQEGIPLYQQALEDFQNAGDLLETALTMAGLGYAYLGLALSVRGSGWLRPSPSRSPFRFVADLYHLLAQLPLVLYLVVQLGVRIMLPVAHRIGRDMDWIVARLLGEADHWFRQADDLLCPDGQLAGLPHVNEGLIRVREEQAHLYRLLNHPHRAEAINLEILGMEGVELDGYRASRAWLGIGHAYLLRGEADEAIPILERVLPIFRAYGHRQRIAQTLTLLARAELDTGQPEKAIGRYQEALTAWQEVGDEARMTDIVYEMEALQEQADLSDEARACVVQVSQAVTRRRYRIRYNHPALITFQRAALLVLVIVSFFALRLAIHTESGTAVGATASLIKPIHRGALVADELSPALELTIEQQLRPDLETEIVFRAIALLLAGYLVGYTAVGLWIIVSTKLHTIQAEGMQSIVTSPEGIRGPAVEEGTEQLAWEEITSLLLSDRVLWRKPLGALSFFAPFAGTRRLVVRPSTRHYEALQGEVQDRLGEDVPVQNLGFSLLGNKSGWLFLASLGYLLLFVLLSRVRPELLTTYVDSIPYNLSLLYGLAYLGIAFPLAYWFAIQPLRARFLVEPGTRVVWWVGGVGVVLTAFYLVQVTVLRLPLGRPDVAVGALSILLVAVAARQVRRARQPGTDGQEGYVYSPQTRSLVLLVAIAAIATASLSIAWELLSFHQLAQGNFYWWKAEELRKEDLHQEAETFYEQALTAYDRSLLVGRNESSVYNSKGAVYAQLGRYPEAIDAYKQARELDPDQWTYTSNIALAYTSWVSDTVTSAGRIRRYQLAIDTHGEAIAGMEADARRNEGALVTAHLLRAAAYYDLGRIYEDTEDSGLRALESYELAWADYQWVIEHDPDEAAGYTGRGWARIMLRKQAGEGIEDERLRLQSAVEDFERATSLDKRDFSAFTGLGWAHNYLARTYSPRTDSLCQKGTDEAEDVTEFENHQADAVWAYNRAILLQPEAAVYYWVRAAWNYLLRDCDNHDTLTQFELMRDDYGRALELQPERADWFFRRAQTNYVLADLYGDQPQAVQGKDYAEAAEAAKEAAIKDYEQSLKLQPENSYRWLRYAEVADAWGLDDKALAAYQSLADLETPDDEPLAAYCQRSEVEAKCATIFKAYWRIGWLSYLLGEYERSHDASRMANTADPDEPRNIFNEGLAHLALGNLEAAQQSYILAIETADALEDESVRNRRYDVALYDLKHALDDPEGWAEAFVRIVTAGRDGLLVDSLCQIVYEPGLVPRRGPGADYDPLPFKLSSGAHLAPLARNPDGQWLKVKVAGTEGWVPSGAESVTCQIDVADIPIGETPPP
jgi:tetratricopeptide (TPR) repeat protein